MQKRNGSYYTPKKLADFVLKKTLEAYSGRGQIRVLEPSCGDGSFIRSMLSRDDHGRFIVDAVEISQMAINRAKLKIGSDSPVNFTCKDFLFYEPRKLYDIVIGNPPFIKSKLLKRKQLVQSRIIHCKMGLKDKTINNIWTPFILKAISHLSEHGVLAFVLPSELLQVRFAQEIQSVLRTSFSRIEIYTFKKLIFPKIGQDTIALIARNAKKSAHGVFFGKVEDLDRPSDKIALLQQSNVAERNGIKWSSHVVSEEDINFLLQICSKINPISHYCNSGAGIVTGANRFFIVDEKTMLDFGFARIAEPIIQRGQFVNGSVVFDLEAFESLRSGGRPSYLLNFKDLPIKKLTNLQRRYIDRGRRSKINERFKCAVRDRWLVVPSVWASEAFFFKRCHLYPKLIKNDAGVLVTDAAYRVRMRDIYCVNSLIYSFYNSLSLAMAELKGRFYGGGVLELTPNEFKAIPLPYVMVIPAEFEKYQKEFEGKKSIENVLKISDERILRRELGLGGPDVIRIQQIRRILVDRRLRIV